MSDASMAEMIGRTKAAVHNRKTLLRKKGFDVPWGIDNPLYDPWFSGSRTVLAKTCSECGWFLDAAFFYIRDHTKRTLKSACMHCTSKRNKDLMPRYRGQYEYDKDRINYDPPDTSRTGHPYSQEDNKIAADPTLTLRQKAFDLRRTYEAVRMHCWENDFRSWPQRLLPEQSEGQWQITFPEAS